MNILGAGVEVPDNPTLQLTDDVLAIANLDQPDVCPQGCRRDRFLKRRLMCHVPTDEHGSPIWFEHLAKRSRGDPLLGVLKADADSLGTALEQLCGSSSIQPMVNFSKRIDEFFAGRLKDELESGSNPDWLSIYTVFGGGDDLVMVGPWNVMFDFAGRLQELFQQGFGADQLTISAGLALTKWKRPIKLAVAEAERRLEWAKTATAPGANAPKDQMAAFGQIWKWRDHGRILEAAKQLADWVKQGEMQRGWLHTLLRLAEDRFGDPTLARDPDPLATARLTHHVVRNYHKSTPSRGWGEQLINDFDAAQTVEVRFLPTIARYALTATRTSSQEN